MFARAYTLLEVLVVVTILGTAAAIVVPSMGSAGNLRVQTAVREVIADITFAQSDAVAYQTRRAIIFFEGEGRTRVEGATDCAELGGRR